MNSSLWFESSKQDLRFALRSLVKAPGFLTVVVLSLALGIGANATMFSVLNALLFRSLPYPSADRLVVIWQVPSGRPAQPPPIADLAAWQKQNDVFEDVALTSEDEGGTASGIGAPQPVILQDVTPNFFSLLGAKPVIGRVFLPEEMEDRAQTVVISYAFWQTHFGGDASVLGKTFRTGGLVSTIVGVMPKGFAPFYGNRIDFWQPVNPTSARYSDRQDHWLVPLARLKPGVTLSQAQTEADVIARRLEHEYPATNKGVGEKIQPLHHVLFHWAKQPLYPLFGAVAFVLLIACANVANLLQSRTETRRTEYAVRASLGAGRARLIRQLLTESGVLALLGGSLGILFAYWGILLFRNLAGDFPGSSLVNVDARVLLFTLSISLLTAFIFGLMPALQASNPNLNDALRDSASKTPSPARALTRNALAVAEIALAMVLLIGVGLMITSIFRLHRVDPGFDTSNLLTMQIHLPEGDKYMQRVPGGDLERATPPVTAFYKELLEKISALPGIQSVGSATGLPMHFSAEYSFRILGQPAPAPESRPSAVYTQVTPGYFTTLKIPLKKGRYFDEHDTEAAPWAIVVNEAFVHRFFPNQDPIGQQLLMRFDPAPLDEDRPRRIVGVVGDIKQYGLPREAPPFIYSCYFQQPAVYPGGAIVSHLWQDIAIRTGSEPQARDLPAAIRKIVSQLDPDQPVEEVMTMAQLLDISLGDSRFYLRILGAFAAIAVLLAIMGIYGVMSYFVNQRTREIGIRVALGARSADVLGMIARTGLRLAIIGVALGAALALALTRLIASFLYGVKPIDPLTYALVALVLVAAAMVACFFPARRAMKADPMSALRYE